MTKVFVADARRRWSDEEKQSIIEESKTVEIAHIVFGQNDTGNYESSLITTKGGGSRRSA